MAVISENIVFLWWKYGGFGVQKMAFLVKNNRFQ
jgi:hypothetical protein